MRAIGLALTPDRSSARDRHLITGIRRLFAINLCAFQMTSELSRVPPVMLIF